LVPPRIGVILLIEAKMPHHSPSPHQNHKPRACLFFQFWI